MTVVFSSVGSVEVGQSLTVTCTITTVARLAVTPNVIFVKINETDMEMLSDLDVPYTITTDDTGAVTNYTLMFNPLRFEDAGMYTCMAEFNVTGYNNTDNPATKTGDMQEASAAFNLIVECKLKGDKSCVLQYLKFLSIINIHTNATCIFPIIKVQSVVFIDDYYYCYIVIPPNVSLAADPPTGPIYESTAYRLICTATVNTTIVNTPVTASVVWTDPRGMIIPFGNARRWVEPPSGDNLISSLLFLPIDIGHFNDNGIYTCAMNLSSANSLISSSQPTSTTINVTVERKLVHNVVHILI